MDFLKYTFLVVCLLFGLTVLAHHRGPFTIFNNKIHRIPVKKAVALADEQHTVFVDARSKEEFQISHIRGAIPYDEIDSKNISADTPIIVYCTVGVRSNRAAKDLSNQGFQNVFDIKGGIIQWANEDQNVYDAMKRSTKEIHVYHKLFAPLLRNGNAIF